jgi:Flp pilus assembly protein TadG
MKLVRNSDGAVAIMIGLLVVIFLGLTAFAVDFGIVWVANKQLSNAADAGALAGARALGYYRCVAAGTVGCTPVSGVTPTGTPDQAAKPQAEAAVAENSAFDTPSLDVDSNTDIVLGKWTSADGFDPTVGSSEFNAVSVTIWKTAGSVNGSVPAFFGPIFNTNEYNTSKNAVAALTGLGSTEEGEVIPVAISELLCPDTGTPTEITLNFGDTGDSCAGWTNLGDPSAGSMNANDMADYIDRLRLGTDSTPSMSVNTDIPMTGGSQSQVFNAFYNLWQAKIQNNASPSTPANGTWKALMPVYAETTNCRNPVQTQNIKGFATFEITYVDCAASRPREPLKSCDLFPGNNDRLRGKLVCNMVKEGAGGGGDYGTYGTIPGLVQ